MEGGRILAWRARGGGGLNEKSFGSTGLWQGLLRSGMVFLALHFVETTLLTLMFGELSLSIIRIQRLQSLYLLSFQFSK